MKKAISYTLYCSFGISTVLNVLYLIDIIGEMLFSIGFAFVMLCTVAMNISPVIEKKYDNIIPETKVKKSKTILLIILPLVWGITYFATVFYK